MEEIKVGEYVRTKNGIVAKIKDIEFDISYRITDGKTIYNNWVEDYGGTFVEKEEIVKHSPNIIDLIEEGDYVNGYKVDEVRDNAFGIMVFADDYQKEMYENHIKTIVTKEYFKSGEYEV